MSVPLALADDGVRLASDARERDGQHLPAALEALVEPLLQRVRLDGYAATHDLYAARVEALQGVEQSPLRERQR